MARSGGAGSHLVVGSKGGLKQGDLPLQRDKVVSKFGQLRSFVKCKFPAKIPPPPPFSFTGWDDNEG